MIKYRRDKEHWFTLWNDNIITLYHNEQCPVLAMRPNTGDLFDPVLRETVKNMFFKEQFLFTAPSIYKKFTQEMSYFFPKQ